MANQTKTTRAVKAQEISRTWHLIDIGGKVLGREVPRITQLLQGKHKRTYVPYLDMGDCVVVINAQDVLLTGKKMSVKEYDSYSGYQGGRKVLTFAQLMARKPDEVVRRAVTGMLPKNKHRDPRLARLFIYAGSEHPYADKFK